MIKHLAFFKLAAEVDEIRLEEMAYGFVDENTAVSGSEDHRHLAGWRENGLQEV